MANWNRWSYTSGIRKDDPEYNKQFKIWVPEDNKEYDPFHMLDYIVAMALPFMGIEADSYENVQETRTPYINALVDLMVNHPTLFWEAREPEWYADLQYTIVNTFLEFGDGSSYENRVASHLQYSMLKSWLIYNQKRKNEEKEQREQKGKKE